MASRDLKARQAPIAVSSDGRLSGGDRGAGAKPAGSAKTRDRKAVSAPYEAAYETCQDCHRTFKRR